MDNSTFIVCMKNPPELYRPPDKTMHNQKLNSLISRPKHMLWVLKRTVSLRRFFSASKTNVLTDGYKGSYMSAHVLLNLLNKLGKRDKMRGLPRILSLFRNEFNKFNKTRA